MRNIVIGIDFSKSTFDATVLDKTVAEVETSKVCEGVHCKFNNNIQGFKDCLAWLTDITGQEASEDWLFCGEDTGHYSMKMSNFLYSKNLFMWLEMPLRIKRSMGIVRGKSDKADSFRIADYAWRHQDKAVRYEPEGKTVAKLRAIFLQRLKFVEIRKALEVRTKDIKDMAGELECVDFIKSETEPIIEKIKDAIGDCDAKMEEIIESDEEIKKTHTCITSIKGISLINSVAFIVYTNNFKGFNGNPRKIATYWGVAVFSQSSGTSVYRPAQTCPMASRMLKALITEAAWASIRWEPRIRDYYNGLLQRGKHPGVALNNVKNKLIHIVTALANSGKKYEQNYEQNRQNKKVA